MAKEKSNTPAEQAVPNTADTPPETRTGKSKAAKPQASQAALAATEEKLAAAEQQIAELKDALLRTAAEYENYRKRSQKEQECTFGNGVGHAACELLPVLDTLDAAANAETTDAEYKKGVLLTLEKCIEVFRKLDIHEIEALGQPFDPELHNAVMQDPAEGAAPGTITQVMQKGYRLNDRVIRHSMVAVAP